MNIKRVLITGARAPVALDLARKFAKRGILVYTADSIKYNLCMGSKAVVKNFIIPKPNGEYEAFISALKEIIKKYAIDLVIPTCEEIFYMAKGLYGKEYKVFCEDIRLLNGLHNKYSFIQLCKKYDIDTPKTKAFYSKDKLLAFIEEFDFEKPLILKAAYSRFGTHVYRLSKKNQKIPKIKIDKEYPWILQEYIEGTQFCTYSIAENGKILAHCNYQNKFTINDGANIYFEHKENQSIYKIIEKLVENLNFTGQIAFDMIQTKDGKIFPIECNPRTTSGIHLFDENIIDALIGRGQTFINPISKGKMLALPMLIYGIKSKGFFHRNWWRDFVKSEDVIFLLKDLVPFLYQFIVYGYFLIGHVKKNKKIEELTTEDIRWNGPLKDVRK